MRRHQRVPSSCAGKNRGRARRNQGCVTPSSHGERIAFSKLKHPSLVRNAVRSRKDMKLHIAVVALLAWVASFTLQAAAHKLRGPGQTCASRYHRQRRPVCSRRPLQGAGRSTHPRSTRLLPRRRRHQAVRRFQYPIRSVDAELGLERQVPRHRQRRLCRIHHLRCLGGRGESGLCYRRHRYWTPCRRY